jgi:hypothetical protein
MTQKQGQICDKLCRKLCLKAVNPDSVGKFVGKTSGTLPHFRSSYKVSTVEGLLKIGKPDSQSPENRN